MSNIALDEWHLMNNPGWPGMAFKENDGSGTNEIQMPGAGNPKHEIRNTFKHPTIQNPDN